jgi:hypothetical protein
VSSHVALRRSLDCVYAVLAVVHEVWHALHDGGGEGVPMNRQYDVLEIESVGDRPSCVWSTNGHFTYLGARTASVLQLLRMRTNSSFVRVKGEV